VRISDVDRFVICYNPEQADRDAAVRQRLLAPTRGDDRRHRRAAGDQAAELRGVISANRLR
jgi:hypothetical protein